MTREPCSSVHNLSAQRLSQFSYESRHRAWRLLSKRSILRALETFDGVLLESETHNQRMDMALAFWEL